MAILPPASTNVYVVLPSGALLSIIGGNDIIADEVGLEVKVGSFSEKCASAGDVRMLMKRITDGLVGVGLAFQIPIAGYQITNVTQASGTLATADVNLTIDGNGFTNTGNEKVMVYDSTGAYVLDSVTATFVSETQVTCILGSDSVDWNASAGFRIVVTDPALGTISNFFEKILT